MQELTATRALTTGVSLNGARPEEYLDRRGAAAYLGVSVRTIDRAIADGRLEAGRVGRLVRIARSACDAMLRHPLGLVVLLVLVAVAVLGLLELVDLLVPGRDFGVLPGGGHPLDVPQRIVDGLSDGW